MNIWEIACAAGIPSAIVGLAIYFLKKYIEKKEAERNAQNTRLEQVMLCIVEGVDASCHLAEATAKAVARIPDAHCNGDMHEALEYSTDKRKKLTSFLTKQGVEKIF